jgi:hypothetical protein
VKNVYLALFTSNGAYFTEYTLQPVILRHHKNQKSRYFVSLVYAHKLSEDEISYFLENTTELDHLIER